MNKKLLLLLIVSLFLISSIAVHAADESILDSVFSALSGDSFNMKSFYDKYGNFVDFTLYLILFIGIAQLTLGKKFEGTGGKAVQIVVGIILAVGLSVWAASQNPKFTLASFGPLAAAVLILIIIVALFAIFKSFLPETTLGKTESFIFAVVLAWWMAQAVSPATIDWIYGLKMVGGLIKATMAILTVVALILLIMKIIVPAFGTLGNKEKSEAEENEVKEESLARREKKFVESGLHDISKGAIKETGHLKSSLERVKEMLNTIQRPEQRQKIISTIQNELLPSFEKIGSLTQKIADVESKIDLLIRKEAQDNNAVKSQLIARYGSEKNALAQINAVKKRLKQEFRESNEVKEIIRKISELESHFKDSLQRAISYINLGDKDHANLYINAAITTVDDIEKEFKGLDTEAVKLDKLVKDSIRRLKAARRGTRAAAGTAGPAPAPGAPPAGP